MHGSKKDYSLPWWWQNITNAVPVVFYYLTQALAEMPYWIYIQRHTYTECQVCFYYGTRTLPRIIGSIASYSNPPNVTTPQDEIPFPVLHMNTSLIARFIWPTWRPPGAARTQVGPMLATRTLLSGIPFKQILYWWIFIQSLTCIRIFG